MTGLADLVSLAELLAEVTGSRHGAARLAVEILNLGASALPRGHDNVHFAARAQLVAAGVVTEGGVVVQHRAAELFIVCEILAASTLPSPVPPTDPRLVLSAPAGTAPIVDAERLSALVLDVIRRSTTSLHIGGAFWNDDGFRQLDEVLKPALTVRAIRTVIYANSPAEARYRGPLEERLGHLAATGPAEVRWFSGPRPPMLHAKFVIADRSFGYLGTANLTSWGFDGHIEAGVELTAGQAERFVTFLEQLEAAGLFTAAWPVERPATGLNDAGGAE